jgi:hypothetical protein
VTGQKGGGIHPSTAFRLQDEQFQGSTAAGHHHASLAAVEAFSGPARTLARGGGMDLH